MSVSARLSLLEERLFDEYSLGSMQPSDEWENDRKSISESKDSFEHVEEQLSAPEEPASPYINTFETSNTRDSFFSHQSSFVEYISNFVPTFSMEGSKGLNPSSSYSTATYSRVESTQKSKGKRSASSHSRCVIENTESIQDRRDDFKEFSRNGERYAEDCTRDESTMSSVEEISQISEITMDIPTVAPEERFGKCTALPTISESKQFDAPIATVCAAGVAAGVVRTKARCSAGTDTTTNKNEGNNDFIDFVFELVEDALCKPIKTSKSERKKVFMEAFHEESEKAFKLANRNSSQDPFRENSKHSRGSRSSNTKRSVDRSKNSSTPVQDRDGSVTEQEETSAHSGRRSGHSRMKVIDIPPLKPPGLRSDFPPDEELTMDWSRMMSLAEKQLEAGEKSVVSEDSHMCEASKISDKSSVYQSVIGDYLNRGDSSLGHENLPLKVKADKKAIDQNNLKSLVLGSVSTSTSTHAALIDEISKDLRESAHGRLADDVVKELRELSALESSSFEEESRFLLTSSLFRFLRSLLPSFGKASERNREFEEQEERAFDEISETLGRFSMDNKEHAGPDASMEGDEMAFKLIRYIAFVYAFVFWPSGIARRKVPNQPLKVFNKKRADSKPASLLQLASKEKR